MKPETASLISAERIERAIQLRYSPFPELTMETLNQQLNQFRIGELRPAARTWEIMLERDGELSTPAEKFFSDIARLPWDIAKDEDSAEADAHAEALRYFYTHLTATSVLDGDETGGINLLLRQLMTAHAFRYSAHEIGLQVSAAGKKEVTATFRHCPVWFFESRKGQLKFLAREGDYDGLPLERGRWLTAVGRGVMRQCSVAYAIKHFPLRDWLYFCSRFGIPGVQGLIDAPKGSTEWTDFEAALEAFANRWVTITSKSSGAEIRLIEAAKTAASLPFKDLVERSDRLYARVFRGGDLSTQSREGADVAGANPQTGETQLVLDDGAQWATDCLNARVDEPVIEYLFNTAPKAWIVISPPKTTDTSREIAAMDFLAKNGGKVAIQTAHERLEIPQAEDGEDVLSAPAPAPSPFGQHPADKSDPPDKSEELEDDALANSLTPEQRLAQSVAADLEPLQRWAQRVLRILEIQDEVLRTTKLRDAQAELPQLLKDINADPASARVIESMVLPALAKGLTNGQAALGNYDDSQPRDAFGRWVDEASPTAELSERDNAEALRPPGSGGGAQPKDSNVQ